MGYLESLIEPSQDRSLGHKDSVEARYKCTAFEDAVLEATDTVRGLERRNNRGIKKRSQLCYRNRGCAIPQKKFSNCNGFTVRTGTPVTD